MEKDIVYRPLPEEVTIKQSTIDGLGLFTTKDIKKGHVFGVSHISDARFENDYIRTPLGGFINHSKEPNCELVKSVRVFANCLMLVSLKNIEKNEEITTKYSLYGVEKEDEKD